MSSLFCFSIVIFMETLLKHSSVKVLFICKQRPMSYGLSYGLLNSCRFLCNALHHIGVHANLVEVPDNNFIDREISRYKPTHVFIEALWVVPEKFEVLIPLHPTVQWHVRIHSNIPFIANEGIAIDWLVKYANIQKKYPQFHISPNSPKMVRDLEKTFDIDTVYSPNVYHPQESRCVSARKSPIDKHPDVFDIGCFGAIRPLKNQLQQAMAAIAFANQMGKTLRFHMNNARVENNGDNVHKNLIALFKCNPKHKLVSHGWMDHEDFIDVVKRMDLGLQVSFSETFNIVAADFVNSKIPLVGSHEIEWLNVLYKANPTDLDSIVSHMCVAWQGRSINLHAVNNIGLTHHNTEATNEWKKLLHIK